MLVYAQCLTMDNPAVLLTVFLLPKTFDLRCSFSCVAPAPAALLSLFFFSSVFVPLLNPMSLLIYSCTPAAQLIYSCSALALFMWQFCSPLRALLLCSCRQLLLCSCSALLHSWLDSALHLFWLSSALVTLMLCSGGIPALLLIYSWAPLFYSYVYHSCLASAVTPCTLLLYLLLLWWCWCFDHLCINLSSVALRDPGYSGSALALFMFFSCYTHALPYGVLTLLLRYSFCVHYLSQ